MLVAGMMKLIVGQWIIAENSLRKTHQEEENYRKFLRFMVPSHRWGRYGKVTCPMDFPAKPSHNFHGVSPSPTCFQGYEREIQLLETPQNIIQWPFQEPQLEVYQSHIAIFHKAVIFIMGRLRPLPRISSIQFPRGAIGS